MNWRRVEIITVLIPKGKKSRETYIIHKTQNTPCISIYFFFVIKLFWGIDLWVWLLTLIYQFVTKYSTDALKSLHLWRKCTNLNNVATSWVILFAIQNLLSFLFFHMYLYFFSHSSKTIYVVLVKCMELSLCNGCHSLSPCLTCFCLFFNILIIFYLPVRSKVRLSSFYITSMGAVLIVSCFVFSSYIP